MGDAFVNHTEGIRLTDKPMHAFEMPSLAIDASAVDYQLEYATFIGPNAGISYLNLQDSRIGNAATMAVFFQCVVWAGANK